jgi:transketolase
MMAAYHTERWSERDRMALGLGHAASATFPLLNLIAVVLVNWS